MFGRLAPAALIVLVLTPATAAAQAPADERANARALADIGQRATASVDAVLEDAGEGPPRCKATARLHRSGTPHEIAVAETLFEAHWISAFARAAQPAVAAAAADMQAVPTADPALRSGRTAWRRVARAYARFGALPRVHYCSQLRDYVRGGFHLTRAMRAAVRMDRRANGWDTSDIDARLAAAVKRLVELGVSPADADAFDGDVDQQD